MHMHVLACVCACVHACVHECVCACMCSYASQVQNCMCMYTGTMYVAMVFCAEEVGHMHVSTFCINLAHLFPSLKVGNSGT